MDKANRDVILSGKMKTTERRKPKLRLKTLLNRKAKGHEEITIVSRSSNKGLRSTMEQLLNPFTQSNIQGARARREEKVRSSAAYTRPTLTAGQRTDPNSSFCTLLPCHRGSSYSSRPLPTRKCLRVRTIWLTATVRAKNPRQTLYVDRL